MTIPIQNIYHLLCYAWNKLEERDFVEITAYEADTPVELFSKILLNATHWQLKRGLYKSYLVENETFAGIKGKVNFNNSLKNNLFQKGFAVCEYDKFSANVLPNQILKSTLFRLLQTEQLPKNLRQEIRSLLPRFLAIDLIPLKSNTYKQVRLDRSNHFYDFLLKICELINEHLLVEEETGVYKFKDFWRDERKMASLFEEFIRNFYRKHLNAKVFREDLQWQVVAENTAFLPKMQTDISIEFPHKKVIIDTKYYQETLQTYFNSAKIHSQNLYQLFAYLKNQPDAHCEGILLYPVVNQQLSLKYQHEGHCIRVETINLSQNWQSIETDLLKIVEAD